jgi:hypothetical protein
LIQGISLSDSSTIRLIAVDDYAKNYTPQQIAEGYYLLDSEVTTFPALNDSLTNSQKKFKKLAKIELTNAGLQDYTFPLAPQDKKDIAIPVPASFDGYESRIMTDY